MEDQLIKEHSFYKYADKVAAICKPLLMQTPINYFGLARIYNNNDYGGLLSDKEWAYFYLKNDFQLLGVEPQLASQGISPVFWNLANFKPTCPQSRKMVDACILFQHACGVLFVTDYPEYKEVCLFSTAHTAENTDPYLVENVILLQKFILFFKEKLHKDKHLMAGLTKRHNNEIAKPDILKVEKKPLAQFEIKKYYLDGDLHNIAFSKREAECLKYLHYGKSAKEIAQLLNLSPRTVETYFNSIKTKTNSKNLLEVISKLESCSFLGAI